MQYVYPNQLNTAKAMLRGKFMALNRIKIEKILMVEARGQHSF